MRHLPKLKEKLCEAPILQIPDPRKTFLVQTDVSDRGVGAVLSQRGDDGVAWLVAYFSKKLLYTTRGEVLHSEKRMLGNQASSASFP